MEGIFGAIHLSSAAWIIRLLLWVVGILKVCEIVIFNRWLLRRGRQYRNDLISTVDPGNESHFNITQIVRVNEKNEYPLPFFWRLHKKLLTYNRPCKWLWTPILAVNRFLAVIVFRQPTAVMALAFLMVILPHATLSYLEVMLVLVLIYSELTDLIFARCLLGFADNFRLDFTYSSYTEKEEQVPISMAHFLSKFMAGIAIFLFTAWFAFGCIYYNRYTLSLSTEWSIALRGMLPRTSPFLQCLYFSLVTLSTVGYGDILPNQLTIQIYVSLEIILGLSVLIFLFFALSNTLKFDERSN